MRKLLGLGLLLFSVVAGCTEPSGDILLDFEVSEQIPTVISVEGLVELGEVDSAHLEVRSQDEWKRIPVALDEDFGFEQILLGQKPDTEYELRVTAECGGTTMVSEAASVRTGPVPPYLPHIATTVQDESLDPGGYIVTSVISFPSVVVILDGDGDPVWWYRAENEEVPITRARLSRDGRSMLVLISDLVLSENNGENRDQPFLRVRLDGSEVITTGIPGAHHDFVEHEDGTVAFLAHDIRQVDNEYVRGDRILELTPDGDLVEVWSVWDNMEFYLDQPQSAGTGWTHANALDFDEEADEYTIGLRNFSLIHRVDRGGGRVLWTLGSPGSDYQLADGGTHFFRHQHQFEVREDSILVMDNFGEVDGGSRVVQFSLDLESAEALPTWSYVAEPQVSTFALGDVQTLPAGQTMVTWSTAGQIDMVSRDDELIRRINVGIGGTFGYAYWLETLPTGT